MASSQAICYRAVVASASNPFATRGADYKCGAGISIALGSLSHLIPFRLNNSAYDVFAISFTYSVGGASCPADFARKQDFLFRSTQVSLPDSRNQCTYILEKWYYNYKHCAPLEQGDFLSHSLWDLLWDIYRLPYRLLAPSLSA